MDIKKKMAQSNALETTDPAKTYTIGRKIGGAIYRLRWLVISIWLAVLVLALPFAAKISGVLTGGGYTLPSSESNTVAQISQQTLHYPVSQAEVIFQSSNTPVTDPSFQAEIHSFILRAKQFPNVYTVLTMPIGADNKTVMLTVAFHSSIDNLEQQIPAFQQILPQGSAASPAKAYLTGDAAIYSELNQVAQTDIEKADSAVFPIALFVLIVVFGALTAAIIPIMLAGIAVPIALAFIYLIALHFTTNVSVLSIASIAGLGLSIDYSLLYIRRFREEILRGKTIKEAVSWTEATSGEAIFFSGITVIIGFASMLFFNIPVMTSLALGGVSVVSIALLGSLTFVPAVLSIIGRRVDSIKIPFLQKSAQGSTDSLQKNNFWRTFAIQVMKRPITIVICVMVLLSVLSFPALKLIIGTPGVDSLPKNSSARQGYTILQQQYPLEADSAFYIIMRNDNGSDILTADSLQRIATVSQWLAAQKNVTAVYSIMNLPQTAGFPPISAQELTQAYITGAYKAIPALQQFVTANASDGVTMVTVYTNTKLDSPEGKALVGLFRNHLHNEFAQVSFFVGGVQAFSLDFNNYLYGNFPKAILFILITTLITLTIMFRSILLPIKAVVMNLISISAAYGVLVWVFQWGNFANLLHFTSEGFVEDTIPVLIFCILFGFSMDYEVFLLSRIREEWLNTRNNRLAIAVGLEKTAGVITSAALIMVIVASAITFTSLLAAKEIGLGMASAIFIDAAIIRSLLVPATMELLGKWNWWFPFVKSKAG